MSKKTNQTRRNIVIAGAAAASSPFWFNIATAQSSTIRIGFPVPLTGPFSAEAQDQVRAAELAIKEFNDAGGFNGRKAELLVRDDKLNPGEAATRTLELIEKDKVDYVVGSLSAATQLSINAVCKERKVIFNSITPKHVRKGISLRMLSTMPLRKSKGLSKAASKSWRPNYRVHRS